MSGNVKKPKLSLTQHQALGERLRRVRQELFDVLVDVDDHYSVKLGLLPAAEDALTSVNRLMDALAEQIFDDHPIESEETLRRVYRKVDPER